MKVKDCSGIIDRPLITIGERETADLAIGKLLEYNIGALPVCDAMGALVGIISERDLLKMCALSSSKVNSTKLRDIMTKEVYICNPDDELDDVMETMRRKGVRHIPILEDKKLVGIISIRDIVEKRLEECQIEVRMLNKYISGSYVSPD